MAVIIKSDGSLRAGKGAIGNIHGFHGPMDYHAMLDFTHRRFIVDGEDRDLSDVISLTRGSEGSYVDVLGRQRMARGNEPRFHTLTTRREHGLLMDRAMTNYATADADGAAFTAPNSNERLVVSWGGSGDVTLNAAAITEVASGVESGRKYKIYDRSSEVSGTQVVSGDVSEVMIVNSSHVPSYFPQGVSIGEEVVKLIGDAALPLLSGTGTIVLRLALMPDDGAVDRNANFSLYNSAAPEGGMRVSVGLRYGTLGTGKVELHADGSSTNSGALVARNLGNRRESAIIGAYFDGFGATSGVISHGQGGSDTAANTGATPPTAFDEVWLSSSAHGMASASPPIGAVLTHCIVYDRMLSDDEAFDVANFTLR